MPIPKSRTELIEYVQSTFEKLRVELDAAGPGAGNIHCVDDWTASVIDWVEAGRRGEYPITPAEGYRWKETPRLNANVVRKCRRESYRSIRGRLEKAYERLMPAIDSLDDHELLKVGVFAWAGNYPISRWISINTARHYITARTFIRRALRGHHE